MLSSDQPSQDGDSVPGVLHRTPLSGGVQSATVKHDLPSPAVAVRNLMEQARHAHLCTLMSRMHHRRAGYPFGSLVDFATDAHGAPLLALSPLAIHTRNVLADSRCNLVVQMPGWSGLANARVTIFGDCEQIFDREAAEAADALKAKHGGTGGAMGLSTPANYLYFRMTHITDVYFVGGFGTVQWVDVGEYQSAQPDAVVRHREGGPSPEVTLQGLNASFRRQLPALLLRGSGKLGAPEEAVLVSIDRGGVDVRVRRGEVISVERLRFPQPVDSTADAHAQLAAMVESGGHT